MNADQLRRELESAFHTMLGSAAIDGSGCTVNPGYLAANSRFQTALSQLVALAAPERVSNSYTLPASVTYEMELAGLEALQTENVKDSSLNGKVRRIFAVMVAAAPPADAPTEDARLFRLLLELMDQDDASVTCTMPGDGTQPDYIEAVDRAGLLAHLRQFPNTAGAAADARDAERERDTIRTDAYDERQELLARLGAEARLRDELQLNLLYRVREREEAERERLAINLLLQAIHNGIYEYGVPDDHALHQLVHEAIGSSSVGNGVEILGAATAAHIADLNQQVSTLRERCDAAIAQIAELQRTVDGSTSEPSKLPRYERETLECAQIVGEALVGPAALHIGHLPDMCRDLVELYRAAIARAEAAERLMPLVRAVAETHAAYERAGSGVHRDRMGAHVQAVRDLRAALAKEGGNESH